MTDDILAAAMVITTTSEFPGREIEKPLGIVTHASVAPAWSRDRSGGRFALSASLLSDTIACCREGLIKEATQRGADAIVAVHFDFEWFNPQSGNLVASSELAVVAYGTAVRLKAPPDTV